MGDRCRRLKVVVPSGFLGVSFSAELALHWHFTLYPQTFESVIVTHPDEESGLVFKPCQAVDPTLEGVDFKSSIWNVMRGEPYLNAEWAVYDSVPFGKPPAQSVNEERRSLLCELPPDQDVAKLDFPDQRQIDAGFIVLFRRFDEQLQVAELRITGTGFFVLFDLRRWAGPPMRIITAVAAWGKKPTTKEAFESFNTGSKIVINSGFSHRVTVGLLSAFVSISPPVKPIHVVTDPDSDEGAVVFNPPIVTSTECCPLATASDVSADVSQRHLARVSEAEFGSVACPPTNRPCDRSSGDSNVRNHIETFVDLPSND